MAVPFPGLFPLLRKCAFLIGKTRRWKWLVLIFLGFVAAGFEAASALLMLFLLAILFSPDQSVQLPTAVEFLPDSMEGVALAIGGFFLVRLGVLTLQTYLQNRMVTNSGVEISGRVLRWYFEMPYASHLARNSAELIRNLTDSADLLARTVLLSLVQLGSEVLIILGLVGVLLWKAPLETLAAAAALGLMMFLIARWIQPRLSSLGFTQQETYKNSLQALQQSLHNLREIRVFGKQDYFHRQFVLTRYAHARAFYLQGTLQALPRLLIETVFTLFVVGLVVITGDSGSGFLDRAPLLGLFAYSVLRVMPSLNRIMFYLNAVRWGSSAVDNLSADLREAEAFGTSQEPTEDVPELADSLVLEDVSFTYSGTPEPALQSVNLRIAAGESIGLVGETGAGKSTLVDVILGLLNPSQGRVLVDGVDIRHGRRSWYRQIAIVPQRISLLDDTLKRNVAFGFEDEEIDIAHLETAIEIAQLTEFVATLPEGIDTRLGEQGVRLSGGQRQRVAIARALYKEANMLILDEGTSALDNLTEAALLESMRSSSQKTVITIAHRLSTVQTCDRVVLLDGGKVADVGSYEELASRNPKFGQMLSASQGAN